MENLTEDILLVDGAPSIVRGNMLAEESYTPYCGGHDCEVMPRTFRRADFQMECPYCGWVSKFPEAFLKAYKKEHNLGGKDES